MAPEDTSDVASIALLHRLRAGAAVHFVHHVDVCSAAPEDLVAGLEPASGIGVWYFYCVKKYKSTHGRPGGHRQRAIAASDTCWHSEASAKDVKGSEGGGTVCNLSYGRKDGRSFSRLGWCMMEYDDATGTGSDYVLCKIYRSPRAQGKPSSAASKTAKRKAGCEHPEARPAKLFHEQNAFFTDDYAMPSTVAQVNARGQGEEEQHLGTQDGEFVETSYGLLPLDVAQINVEEWIRGMEMFEGEEEQQSSKPEQDDGSVKVAPLLTEDITVEDCLLAPETTTSGEATGMPATFTPADVNLFDLLQPDSEIRVLQEQQTLPQSQHPHAAEFAPETTTSGEASGMPLPTTFTPADVDLSDLLEPDSVFSVVQEQQTLQMQQTQAPEPDLQSPYAAAMALACQLQESDRMMRRQQQESHWMMQQSFLQAHPFQLPCLMC